MTDTDSRVTLVTGGSGFVGSHIVRQLVAQGRKVRVLLRKSSSQEALEGPSVEIVYGDVLDPESLRAAMQGCGTVFYSVVDPRFWLTDQTIIFRNNVDGLVNAMDAALECGIQRFVFTSTMGTLGINPDGPVTEDIPFNWLDRAPPYIRARLEAENRLLTYCREKGLPGVALCIANTYGPDDYQPTPHNHALWDVARGKMPIGMDVGQPTVDIRDAAQAALLAEKHGRIGERYIIANEYVRNRDFYAMATKICGTRPPRFISYKAGYTLAWTIERVLKLLRRKDYLVSTDAMFLSDVFRELDNGKARRELGWTPRPLEETVRDAIAWFSSREEGEKAEAF
ncbi:NAD-dependent epimerase/dehydratase family protein [Novosphingobium mangrovi (ex Huang et al. 2023)]|uniref:NAD-dependent epimerase/dehydratase family protein n=1 Tax=Novosphingobium mangrovi (ex Huang et al. 2023) TaxID=2976432 RepID=A0ABT2I4A1_9SPHN|nr:NAD-dependent epimerase/dehydratase family protein [Novosphingobium mangrovi (ex Huang et al. 2023)]MCT2399631.1 NAD-dependent epimerase/dehydratase family protein [Novosphingobium mangrovi (ex Huang et al. 2023)]